jgi:conjugal transfer pilus assembly protein TraF
VKKLDLKTHQNLAQRFGVTMVPSIILLHRDTQKVLPVSTGVVSMDELKNSIYQSVLMFEGKITPEQYGLAIKSRQAAMAEDKQ